MSTSRRTDYLYLNNAGAGLPSPSTLRTQIAHLELEARVGAYVAAMNEAASVKLFYDRAAQIIGVADPTTIAFMDSASRAWNMALYGAQLKARDKIVTLSSEFGTNLVSVYHYAHLVGAEVEVIPCGNDGTFSLDDMETALQGATLLAVSHVAAHAAIVNPVEWLGSVAKKYDVTFLLDGCQSLGQFPVNIATIGCDAYTATGRKWLCGPRGTGFLYIRPGSRFETPYVDLANAALSTNTGGETYVEVTHAAKQFELWERSIAGLLGLSQAMGETIVQLEDAKLMEEWAQAARQLSDAVMSNSRLTLLGKQESASKTTGFIAADEVLQEASVRFKEAGLQVSTMGPWDAPRHIPANISNVIRLAPHYYTPQEAIDRAVEVIKGL